MNTETNYPEVVQAIHSEFLTAGDRLLAETIAIIKDGSKSDLQKAELFKATGFENTNQSHLLESLSQVKENQKLRDSVMEYKRLFPNNKFISDKDVELINKKYGLVIGLTEQYTGFIPNKNLHDISNFLKQPSVNRKAYKITKLDLFQWIHLIPWAKWRFKAELRKYHGLIFSDSERGAEMWISNLAKRISEINGDTGYHSGYLRVHAVELEEKKPFMICAPKKDMNKFSLNIKFKSIPDPIVLYPVDLGYIIVTAWGDEAKDPLILNEKNN